MTAKTETPKSGNAINKLPNSQPSKVADNSKKVEQNEQEDKKMSLELIKKFQPSAEQRLQKLDNFRILGERHSFLKKKEDELSKFIVSSDGTREKITLSNASGFTFEVSNSQTIEKVVNIIENHLKTFVQKSEEEILNFHI